MKKRRKLKLIALMTIISMLVIGPIANAQDSSNQVGQVTQEIWCGLINGSNFNFSDCNPPKKQQPQATTPASTAMPQPQPKAAVSYVALGDSVAAGLGLPLTESDATSIACGRSSDAYPNIVAQKLQLSLQSYACSGATAGDLVTSEDTNGVELQPQLAAAFAQGTPRYISITAGANDIEWSSFLKACYAGDCATTANTVAMNTLLVTLQAKLVAALASIQIRSHGSPPTTFITGYYEPISARCMQQDGQLSTDNFRWIQETTDSLNQTLKQTAQVFPFARFVPVDFTGHDICSSDPWVQSANDAAPFHPTAKGQAVIADAVAEAISAN